MGKAIKRFGWKQQDLVVSTKVSSAPRPKGLFCGMRRWDADTSDRSIGAAQQTAAVKKPLTIRACPAST